MNVIIEDPILTKNEDYSITCSFKIQYVTLPIAVPNPSKCLQPKMLSEVR